MILQATGHQISLCEKGPVPENTCEYWSLQGQGLCLNNVTAKNLAKTSSPLWLFKKFFPRILCNHKHFFFFFNYSICRLFTQCESGGWAHVIPTPGFQNEKAVCYLMFLWLWPKQQSLTDVSSEIIGYRVTKKIWFRVDLPCSISDVPIRLWGQRTSGRSWKTVKK